MLYRTLKHFLTLVIIYFIFINGCKNIGDQVTGRKDSFYSVRGLVQKGPFISGVSVIVQELDIFFNTSGRTHVIKTTDDLGYYVTGENIKSNYVEIIASGLYFNEVTNRLSDTSITLRAVADLELNNVVNINLLTTLQADRIMFLIENTNKSYPEAMEQSESEILNTFNISTIFDNNFFEMDISSSGENNAALLAASLILQGQDDTVALTELISNINLDIKEDGVLDSLIIIDKLKSNADIIDSLSEDIRDNLNKRYSKFDAQAEIPGFELFIRDF